MSDSTIHDENLGGYLESSGGDFEEARSGIGDGGVEVYGDPSEIKVGYTTGGRWKYIDEGFVSFDLTAAAGWTITAASMYFVVSDDSHDAMTMLYAHAVDWGATLEEGDWEEPDGLGTLLCWTNPNTYSGPGTYGEGGEPDPGLLAAVQAAQGGKLRVVLTPGAQDDDDEYATGAVTFSDVYLLITYTSANLVSVTRQIKWTVANTRSVTRAAKWSVAALVNKTRQVKWGVNGLVAVVRAAKWSVANPRSVTRQAKWSVATRVNQTRQVKWGVASLVSQTRAVQWGVNSLASVTRAAKWTVAGLADLTRQVKWSVLGTGMNLPDILLEGFDLGWSTASSGGSVDALHGLLPLDPAEYEAGSTFYFEVVAYNAHASIDYTLTLRNYTDSGDATTVVIPHGGSVPVRYRSAAFTPATGLKTYAPRNPQTAANDNVRWYSWRIVVVPAAASTKARIQRPMMQGTYNTGARLDSDNYTISTASTTYVAETGVSRWRFDRSSWQSLPASNAISLECILASVSGTETASVCLWDVTAGAMVPGVEVSVTGTTLALAKVDFDASLLANGHIYGVRAKTSNASSEARVYAARLYIRVIGIGLCETYYRVGGFVSGTAGAQMPHQRVKLELNSAPVNAAYMDITGFCADNADRVYLCSDSTNDSGVAGWTDVVAHTWNSDSRGFWRSGSVSVVDGRRYVSRTPASTATNAAQSPILVVACGVPPYYADSISYDGPFWAGTFRDIIKVEGTYYSWEESLTGSVWACHRRTSADGVSFADRSSALMSPGGSGSYDEYGQADPTVVYDGPGDWKLWHDGQTAAGVWSGLGYATSADGATWAKYGMVLSVGGVGEWDHGIVHHPTVLKHDGTYYMFYTGGPNVGITGGSIGLATSTDGINWTKYASNPVLAHGATGVFDAAYVRPSRPVYLGGQWVMFYWGEDGLGLQAKIGVATSPDLIHWTKQGIAWEPPDDRTARDVDYVFPYGPHVGDEASAPIFEDGVAKVWYMGLGRAVSSSTYLATMEPYYLEQFGILPIPIISGITPNSGVPTNSVTISGLYLTGTTAVAFGAVPAASFSVVSDTEITAVAPAGTGVVDVTVTTPFGVSEVAAADEFTYLIQPDAPPTTPSPRTYSIVVHGEELIDDIELLSLDAQWSDHGPSTFACDIPLEHPGDIPSNCLIYGAPLSSTVDDGEPWEGNVCLIDVQDDMWHVEGRGKYAQLADDEGYRKGFVETRMELALMTPAGTWLSTTRPEGKRSQTGAASLDTADQIMLLIPMGTQIVANNLAECGLWVFDGLVCDENGVIMPSRKITHIVADYNIWAPPHVSSLGSVLIGTRDTLYGNGSESVNSPGFPMTTAGIHAGHIDKATYAGTYLYLQIITPTGAPGAQFELASDAFIQLMNMQLLIGYNPLASGAPGTVTPRAFAPTIDEAIVEIAMDGGLFAAKHPLCAPLWDAGDPYFGRVWGLMYDGPGTKQAAIDFVAAYYLGPVITRAMPGSKILVAPRPAAPDGTTPNWVLGPPYQSTAGWNVSVDEEAAKDLVTVEYGVTNQNLVHTPSPVGGVSTGWTLAHGADSAATMFPPDNLTWWSWRLPSQVSGTDIQLSYGPIPVTAQALYDLSVIMGSDAGTGHRKVWVQWQTALGANVSTTVICDATATSDAKLYEVLDAAPATAAQALVFAAWQSGTASGALMYVSSVNFAVNGASGFQASVTYNPDGFDPNAQNCRRGLIQLSDGTAPQALSVAQAAYGYWHDAQEGDSGQLVGDVLTSDGRVLPCEWVRPGHWMTNLFYEPGDPRRGPHYVTAVQIGIEGATAHLGGDLAFAYTRDSKERRTRYIHGWKKLKKKAVYGWKTVKGKRVKYTKKAAVYGKEHAGHYS